MYNGNESSKINKVLLPLPGGSCPLQMSYNAIRNHVDSIVVAAREKDMEQVKILFDSDPDVTVVCGGDTRQKSVANCLKAVENSTEYIMVQDGARCMVDEGTILKAKASAEQYGSGVAGMPLVDTIKQIDITNDCVIAVDTPDRSKYWAVQTPQCFSKALLLQAHAYADKIGFEGTDDASLVEKLGVKVHMTMGSRGNIKLTTQDDLHILEAAVSNKTHNTVSGEFRIGSGYDVHRLTEGRKLILCGVEIPHTMGLLGHSDADVAVHALMDAMLGALALGDIGQHFPDNDDMYKGISSITLLKEVNRLIHQKTPSAPEGAEIVNADITISAQKPKLMPYILQMRQTVADALQIDVSRISVKATTTEHLGFEGREEGISAQAVVMLRLL